MKTVWFLNSLLFRLFKTGPGTPQMNLVDVSHGSNLQPLRKLSGKGADGSRWVPPHQRWPTSPVSHDAPTPCPGGDAVPGFTSASAPASLGCNAGHGPFSRLLFSWSPCPSGCYHPRETEGRLCQWPCFPCPLRCMGDVTEGGRGTEAEPGGQE